MHTKFEADTSIRSKVIKLVKIFAPPQTPFPGGAGRPKFNQPEMVITLTYRPSSVKIDARNFELSW